MTDRELMQQALEALEQCAVTIDWEFGACRDLEEMRQTGKYTNATTPAIAALRSRLAQPEQEPIKESSATHSHLWISDLYGKEKNNG